VESRAGDVRKNGEGESHLAEDRRQRNGRPDGVPQSGDTLAQISFELNVKFQSTNAKSMPDNKYQKYLKAETG
jgi:hypothetical protein